MKSFLAVLDRFFTNKRNLFIFGAIVTFALSLSEVTRGKQYNFIIFSNATHDFWKHIIPYGMERAMYHGRDLFLYGPVFNIFFAPFAYLPPSVGPFVWNLFNYTLYFIAIFTLPSRQFTEKTKCYMYLYTMLILACTQLSFQFNVTVAYIFLFAYTLLEKNKPFWAIVLVLFSGFTKVYGIFQLGLLLCYPRFWRNMGYVAIVAAVYFFLPLVNMPFDELIPYYQSWINGLTEHQTTRTWETVFYIQLLFPQRPEHMHFIQMGVLSAIIVLFSLNYKKYNYAAFRVQSVAILMGWIILFSNAAERHTYVIALIGYLMWFWSRTPALIDRWLFWLNFIVLVVIPVDVLCPVQVMKFVFNTLDLNLYLFLFTWLRMVYITLISKREPAQIHMESPQGFILPPQ